MAGQGKKIVFTVTNDLVFDQRMQRICNSMVQKGYKVTLIGREMPGSPALTDMPYQQIRLKLRHQKGKLFYMEYNFKLYKYLIKQQVDAICAIDLDTIIPVYFASQKKRIPRMYDAHEFFTEMIEVRRRPHIHFIWKKVEKWFVPRFTNGYTVGQAIADDLKNLYGVNYAVVRNMPHFADPLNEMHPIPKPISNIMETFNLQCPSPKPYFLYQGAINEGRALIPLLEAMKIVNGRLLMAGTGNMDHEVKAYIQKNSLEHKVHLCGNVPPDSLKYLTANAYAGITIFDSFSKNQYYSLANKFFDYIMAHKPQVCVYYPEYAAILKQFPVAIPLHDTRPETIAAALNKMIEDPVLYKILRNACPAASIVLNWEVEEIKLLESWDKLFRNY